MHNPSRQRTMDSAKVAQMVEVVNGFATRALRWAASTCDLLRALGITVRNELHTGEIELKRVAGIGARGAVEATSAPLHLATVQVLPRALPQLNVNLPRGRPARLVSESISDTRVLLLLCGI